MGLNNEIAGFDMENSASDNGFLAFNIARTGSDKESVAFNDENSEANNQISAFDKGRLGFDKEISAPDQAFLALVKQSAMLGERNA